MSEKPHIKVVLHDGENSDTWVTYVPIRQLDDIGAKRAAGNAFSLFIASLDRDRHALTRRLRKNAP